jgi:hypothetical protein
VAGRPRFHYLHCADDDVAYAPQGDSRGAQMASRDRAATWTPVTLELRDADRPLDYLANTLGVRLCSPRLREVIDAERGPRDSVEWLPATVTDPAGVPHPYFVLHTLADADVLDPERTLTGPSGSPIRPVVDPRRVTDEQVMSFPGASVRLIVTDRVRRAIERAGCTGVRFSAVATTP